MRVQVPRSNVRGSSKLAELLSFGWVLSGNARPHPGPLLQERVRGPRHGQQIALRRVLLRIERGDCHTTFERIIRVPSPGGEGTGEGGPIERRQKGWRQIRRLLCVALCFLGSWILELGTSAAAPLLAGSRPNIIFILTDDQGYGDISAHGNPILKTPNLDRLHREGVRFTDFHVSPTCAPTRSALLTGRHEFKNGVTHTIFERERLTLKATTLAQVLKQSGYTTGI